MSNLLYLCSFSSPGATLPSAPEDEARQESVCYHLCDWSGVTLSGSLRPISEAVRVSLEDWNV